VATNTRIGAVIWIILEQHAVGIAVGAPVLLSAEEEQQITWRYETGASSKQLCPEYRIPPSAPPVKLYSAVSVPVVSSLNTAPESDALPNKVVP
jgi:hypothetical protein